MNRNLVGRVALILVLIAPVQTYAASFDGLDDNTTPPTVIVPPTTAAPQTPANPPPLIGVSSLPNFAPLYQARQFHTIGGRGR
jgi:hypothetical protein